MNLLVTGSSGLVGRAVMARLTGCGHQVTGLHRGAADTLGRPSWDPEAGEVRVDPSAGFDGVIHLAGETIAQRWTASACQRIRASRVEATRLLSEALAGWNPPPRVMLCASATGYYGDRGDEVLTESSAMGTGFLAEVCAAWEAAAEPARRAGVRVVHLRLGIVLAREGGALARMLPIFRLGLGGRVGHGRQYWSWITLEDVARVVEWALQDSNLTGPVNVVAPEATTNAAFTAALGRSLRRPTWLPAPALMVRAALGRMGQEALLSSARVRPARLLDRGFCWQWPELDAALGHLLGGDEKAGRR